ncbi:translation initiation factor IF-2-like [Acinonyx jubatus]|uniref:Translation initiation factor IF-2-like n=1 Tax=Acinonyx jubatus TaxID=32536 RepID=A0ABM3NLD6_ACIJB|nr:translation initiation factor IF-2-like [Acinonyx jubatus]
MCHRAGKVQGYSPEHCGRIPEWRSQAKLCREPTMCVREGERERLGSAGADWGRGAGSCGVSPARARAPGPLRRNSAPRFAAVCRPPGGAPCTWPRSEREDRAELPPPPPAPSSVSSSSRGPLGSPPPAAPLALSQSPPPGARGAGGKRLPPRRGAGRAGRWRARSCGAGGRARELGACAATALQRRSRRPRSRGEGPAPTPAASRGSRVNELDFGFRVFGGKRFALHPLCTRARTHTHTHTHSPPPKFRLSARVGWRRGGSKGYPDNGERKSCIQKFLTSFKEKNEKLTTVTQKSSQIRSSTRG